MPRGTVKTFEKEKGFGTIQLDSGEELPFDISASNKIEFRIGEAAEVTVGVGYTGRPKAKLVVFEVEADRAPSFKKGFETLQSFGFLKTWTLAQAKSAIDELLGEVPEKLLRADAGGLFQSYYGEGLSELGRAEGVLVLDWRFGQVTQTPVEDLLAIAPGVPAVPFTQQGSKVTIGAETIELADGLMPLVLALNRTLENANAATRYFSLDFEGDFYVLAHREAGFAAAAAKTSVWKLD